MSDHELLDELQSRLLLTVQRSMGLAPGRGMLHLNTVAPIATQTMAEHRMYLPLAAVLAALEA